jgi:hypothetical protein
VKRAPPEVVKSHAAAQIASTTSTDQATSTRTNQRRRARV